MTLRNAQCRARMQTCAGAVIRARIVLAARRRLLYFGRFLRREAGEPPARFRRVGALAALLACCCLVATACRPHAKAAESVAVRVVVPGRSAADIETQVVIPLERAAGGAGIESLSVAGAAWLRVEGPRELTLRQLAAVPLPDAEALEVVPDPGERAPRLRYTLSSARLTLAEIREIHDELLAPGLQMISGVVEVRACGGGPTELSVEIDPERLRAHAARLEDVRAAVASAPRLDLETLALPGGLTLRDVAAVRESMRPRCWARAGSGPVVLGEVVAKDEQTREAVRAALVAPEGLTLRVVADGEPAIVALVPGQSDALAEQTLAELVKLLPGAVAEIDRSPRALPRLATEVWVHAGGHDPAALARLPGVRVVPGRWVLRVAPSSSMELVVVPDQARLARFGLTTHDVDLAVAAARDGVPAGPARIWITGGVSPSLPVGPVRLDEVARIEERLVPEAILRRGGERVKP